ncbi:hypothetical protein HDV00_003713 [Rhizophlyctis rosea]|nr:hypothetical protein HDV00_003713 [Rhizophlyctis rosea]
MRHRSYSSPVQPQSEEIKKLASEALATLGTTEEDPNETPKSATLPQHRRSSSASGITASGNIRRSRGSASVDFGSATHGGGLRSSRIPSVGSDLGSVLSWATPQMTCSFAEFVGRDVNGRGQKMALAELEVNEVKFAAARQQRGSKDAKAKDGGKNKKDNFIKPADKKGTLGKLGALLKGKKKKRSTSGMFHLLRLAIHDHEAHSACQLLEDVTPATLRKKYPKEANGIFVFAMSNGMEIVCRMMIEKGFPLDVTAPAFKATAQGKPYSLPSYLGLAVGLGLDNLVRAMIKATPRINVNINWFGLTPLHQAAARGSQSVIQLLLDCGADPTQGVPFAQYQILQRLKGKDNTMAEIRGSPNGLPRMRRQFGGEERGKSIAEKFAEHQLLPLDIAAATGNVEAVRVLLSRMDPDQIAISTCCLVIQLHFDAMAVLVKGGVNISQKDPSGATALHLAARAGNLEVAMMLVQSKADINMKGENGWTPLHEAISTKSFAVVRYLLKCAANTQITNNAGETPSQLGVRMGIPEEKIRELFDDSQGFPDVPESLERSVWTAMNAANSLPELPTDRNASIGKRAGRKRVGSERGSDRIGFLPGFLSRGGSAASNATLPGNVSQSEIQEEMGTGTPAVIVSHAKKSGTEKLAGGNTPVVKEKGGLRARLLSSGKKELKDAVKDAGKDGAKDAGKDGAKDAGKDGGKDAGKDGAKDGASTS